jgi:hypothetical protein
MPEGKRLIGKPRCRWEDNNEMVLRERVRVVWTVMSSWGS